MNWASQALSDRVLYLAQETQEMRISGLGGSPLEES